MKKIIIYLIILQSALLLSCSKETTIIQDETKNSGFGGTDSTGGGNGIDSKPVEEYIVEINTTPSYKNFIFPLIIKLRTDYPTLANDFYHIAHQRIWYIVPVPLDTIPKNILGTYAVTDQIAIQDLGSIWINTQLFEKMNEKSQATLLVHEIVMGVRLMQYKEKVDHCIASVSSYALSGDYDAYHSKRSSCIKTYGYDLNIPYQKFNLSSKDYDLIRKITYLLTQEKIDISMVKSLIEDTGFRKYN